MKVFFNFLFLFVIFNINSFGDNFKAQRFKSVNTKDPFSAQNFTQKEEKEQVPNSPQELIEQYNKISEKEIEEFKKSLNDKKAVEQFKKEVLSNKEIEEYKKSLNENQEEFNSINDSYTSSVEQYKKDNKNNPLFTELKGDTKLACEVILCLSSSSRPKECIPPIKRYFSIRIKHHGHFSWWRTLRARKNFLNLCPVGDMDNNADFTNLRDNIILHVKEDCTKENLNKRVEVKTVKEWTKNSYNSNYGYNDVAYFRIDTKPTESCKLLSGSPYTAIRPEYTCNKEWYKSDVWEKGYKVEYTNFIDYGKMSKEEKAKWTFEEVEDGMDYYYRHIPVKVEKDCWKLN